MSGPFRDLEHARAERVAELTRAIGTAERQLASLDLEVEELSATQRRQLLPSKAPIAPGPHAAGLVVGVVFGFPVAYILGAILLYSLWR
jgi:hypothetical protein